MKLLINLFNKYMSAEKETDNYSDKKFLQKKRAKSKKRTKIDDNDFSKKRYNSLNNENIEDVKHLINHFFRFDWDSEFFEKDSIKISKYITSSVFWFLIDSSYFKQNNIKNNVNRINEKYLDDTIINETNNETIDNKKYSLLHNNDIINNDKIEKNKLNNMQNNIKRIIPDNTFFTIINFMNYIKKEKSVQNHSINGIDEILPEFKKTLSFFLDFVHKKNKDKFENLRIKSKLIQSEYESKNNVDDKLKDKLEDKLDQNYSSPKNKKSYNIRNKFLNYLHKKEKDFLIKREQIYNQQEKDKDKDKENKDEINEDNFYIDSCNVCNVEDLGIYNNLYECRQCGIRVHQLCYRIKTNPDPQKWKCSKCKSFSSKEANNLECLLCPNKGGAMQRTKLSKDSKFYQEIMDLRKSESKNIEHNIQEIVHINNEHKDYPWIHLTCALSNSDVKIDIFDKKKPIKFEENNILTNYNAKCGLCNMKNYGPTIKCKFANCNKSCHPECARINDYYFDTENFEKGVPFHFYCHEHRPNRFIKYINKSTLFYDKEIFDFSQHLKYVFNSYKQKTGVDIYKFCDNDKEQNSDSNNKEEIDRKLKENRMKSRSRNKANKSLRKKIKKNSLASVQAIVIKNELNGNNLPEKSYYNYNCNEVNNTKINNLVKDIKTNINENISNSNNVNMTNETNSIKSNNSHNSSENNKFSTKYESLVQSSEESKYELTMNLFKHLQKYFTTNRIVLTKDNGNYLMPKSEDYEAKEEALRFNMDNVELQDIKEGKYGINKLNFKKELNNEYENIYKDEEEFQRLYKDNLDKFLLNAIIPTVENIEIKKEKNFGEENKNKGRRKISKSKKIFK